MDGETGTSVNRHLPGQSTRLGLRTISMRNSILRVRRCMSGMAVFLLILTVAGCGNSPATTGATQTPGSTGTVSEPTQTPTEALSHMPSPSVASSPSVAPTPAHGHFSPTGSLVAALSDPIATVLADGRVLVTGADTASRAEIYDPATGTFSETGAMVSSDGGNPGTLLRDDRVLIAGGSGTGASQLYDPATGTFSATGSMVQDRYDDIALRLNDGRVLIAGGYEFALIAGGTYQPGGPIASAELYDPATGKFSRTGSMSVARGVAAASLLPDGRVLIAGGEDLVQDEGVSLASAEVYDPATGKFTRTGNLPVPCENATATLLRNGRVLVAGCWTGTPQSLATGELYDPKTGKFSATGPMINVRGGPTATLLQDGRVLVAGGSNENDSSAEIYDPSTGTFSPTGSMMQSRLNGSAVLLPDGRVLLVGGSASSPTSAETYWP